MDKKQYYLEIAKEIKKAHSLNSRDNNNDKIWEKAYALYNIISSGEYLIDFTSRTDFANYLKMNKSYLSRLIKAVEYDKINHFNHTAISVDKVYTLSALGDELPSFKSYLKEMKLDLEHMNVNDIRRIRNDYLSDGFDTKKSIKYKSAYNRLLQSKDEQDLLAKISKLSESAAKGILLYAIRMDKRQK